MNFGLRVLEYKLIKTIARKETAPEATLASFNANGFSIFSCLLTTGPWCYATIGLNISSLYCLTLVIVCLEIKQKIKYVFFSSNCS